MLKPIVNYDTVTVEHAAKFLQCSTRRVRFLLANSRLYGYKDEMRATRPWKVLWPLTFMKAGTRGPDIKRLPQRMPKQVVGKYGKE